MDRLDPTSSSTGRRPAEHEKRASTCLVVNSLIPGMEYHLSKRLAVQTCTRGQILPLSARCY